MKKYIERIIEIIDNVNVLSALTNGECQLSYQKMYKNYINIQRKESEDYFKWNVYDSNLQLIIKDDDNVPSLNIMWNYVKINEFSLLSKLINKADIEFSYSDNESYVDNDVKELIYDSSKIFVRIKNVSLDQLTKLIQIYAKIDKE